MSAYAFGSRPGGLTSVPFATLGNSLHALLESPPPLGGCHVVIDAGYILQRVLEGSAPGPLPRAGGRGLTLAQAHTLSLASRSAVTLSDAEWGTVVSPLCDALVDFCRRFTAATPSVTVHLVCGGFEDGSSSLRACQRQRRSQVLAKQERHGKGMPSIGLCIVCFTRRALCECG